MSIIALPKGYTIARDALNAIGHHLHGERWSGSEFDAVAPGWRTPEDYDLWLRFPPRGSDARGSGRRASGGVASAPRKQEAPPLSAEEYKRQYDAYQAARDRIEVVLRYALDRLLPGELKALGVDRAAGMQAPVPADTWLRGNAAEMVEGGWVEHPRWSRRRELLIAEIVAPSPVQVSMSHRERECQRWFEELMRASPDGDNIGKPERQKEAQERFNVSGAGATRARDRAIEETGSLGWRKAGAKRKS